MKAKQFLSVLLCVALVLTLLPSAALSADVTLEVTHATAGALSAEIAAALGGNPASSYTKLKIYVGDAPLNGNSNLMTGDWWVLYNLSDTLPNVTSLELVYTSGNHTIPDDALCRGLYVGPAWFQALTLTNSGGSLTRIGNSAFCYCEALTGTLVIPATVTSIGEYAFWDTVSLTGLSLPATGSLEIGKSAFGYSNLTGTLEIPSSVTGIGDGAFSGCRRLTGTLEIPSSVTRIGNGAFSGCSGFTGLSLPAAGSLEIGNGAFAECGLTGTLEIPSSVTRIGNGAFNYCTNLDAMVFRNTTAAPEMLSAITNQLQNQGLLSLGCGGFLYRSGRFSR